MVSKLGSKERWDTRHSATYGAQFGILLGMLEQFCHVFYPASWGHALKFFAYRHASTE
jgi:hypothetical protein